VVKVARGDGEAEPVDDEVEGDVPIGAMGPALLLGLDELGTLRVDRGAVVRGLVEIDSDIDEVRRDEGTSLFPKSEGERSLGLPSVEVLEHALAVPFGRTALRAGSGPSDGVVPGGRPEDQIGDTAANSRGKLALKADGEEREEPREGAAPRLPIGEGSGGPPSPRQRCLFLFGLVISLGRKPGSVAFGVHNLASRSLPLQTRVRVELAVPGDGSSSTDLLSR
jgi:hypothetical protein